MKIDQAEGLRKLMDVQTKPLKIISIASGKGGVGKSNFTLNFALALQSFGKKVLIMDMDLGMANIEILLGTLSQGTMFDFLNRQKSFEEVIQKGPQDIHYVTGGSSFSAIPSLSEAQVEVLSEQFVRLQGRFDYLLLDIGAGVSKVSLSFMLASEEIILLTTPEPTALTDAYALMKIVTAHEGAPKFKIIVNRAQDFKEGSYTLEKFSRTARRFLSLDTISLGYLLEDEVVSKSVRNQAPFFCHFPKSRISRQIRTIAQQYLSLERIDKSEENGLRGFFQKMRNLLR